METKGTKSISKRRGFSAVPPKVRWFIYLLSFASVGYGYLLVAITAYLPEIGFSSGDVGLILGANGASFAISAIPIGLLSDRKGRKWILISGLFVLSPSLLVYALTTNVTTLVLAGIAAGVAEGAFLSTWNAMIADMTTLENRVAAYSLSFICQSVTMGIGMTLPFVFPLIETWTGLDTYVVHNGTYVLLAIVSLLSPITLWLLLKDQRESIVPEKSAASKEGMGLLLKFSGLNSLIGLGAGFIIPLIPTWLFLRFGVSDAYSGPLLAVAGITIGFATLASSALALRFGAVRAIVMTQGLSTVFMLSLAFVPTAALAGVLYLVRSTLMNMSSPLADSLLMGIVPKEQRGLASAINSLIWRLPNSVSTIFGGMLLASGSYDVPFFIAAAFYIVSITLFYRIFKNVKPKE